MSAQSTLSYRMPGGSFEDEDNSDYGLVNDSFGTIHIADSTGLDDDMETGDAKMYNFPTHED
jgi:hypothetical protein